MMSPDAFNITHPANWILSIVSGTIGAAGAPANFFLICFILSEYKKRKPHEWLLLILAIGDFILCFNNVTLEAPFIIRPFWMGCKIAGAIEYTCGPYSFLMPPVVAYNRYLALYNNQKYSKVFTTKNVFLMWPIFLLFSICWIVPFAVTGNLGQDDLGLCGAQMRTEFLTYVAGCALLMLLILYCILIYFSYKVVLKIRNHKVEAGGGRSQIQSRLIKESKDIITAMLIISIVPLFAQVPAVLVKLLHVFLPPFNPWISRSATALFPLTSASNAYVTVYVVKDYRRRVIKFMKRRVAPLTSRRTAAGRARSSRMQLAESRPVAVQPYTAPN